MRKATELDTAQGFESILLPFDPQVSGGLK